MRPAVISAIAGAVLSLSGRHAAAQTGAPLPAAEAPAQAPEEAETVAAPPAAAQADDREVPAPVPAEPSRDARVAARRHAVARLELPPDRQRLTEVYGIAGLGTPVGFEGLELVRRLAPSFELAVGLGAGLAVTMQNKPPAGASLQWSLMPRLRLGQQLNALTVGVGLSGGGYGKGPSFSFEDEGPPSTTPDPTQYTLWANFEAGGEHIARGGFAFRYFAGFAHGWPAGGGTPISTLVTFPYFGCGFGYAF